MVAVSVTGLPGATNPAEGTSATVAAPRTAWLSEAALLPMLGSSVDELAEAASVNVPAELAATTRVKVATAPEGEGCRGWP